MYCPFTCVPGLMLCLTTLPAPVKETFSPQFSNKNEFLKKHITPVDVVFYVLEGQGVVEIGEEKAQVEADTLIESPARIAHRWINESQKPLRILVIKTPRPKEATKML